MSALIPHRANVSTVREWLQALGILTAGDMTRADAELKLRAYVPLLQREFPAAAFTDASLSHVAERCKWFPSYAEVVEHLRAWWKPRRPPLAALPPPDIPPPRPEPTDADRAYIAARVAEAVAHLTSREPDHRADAPRAAHLSAGVLDAINPLPGGRKRVTAQ